MPSGQDRPRTTHPTNRVRFRAAGGSCATCRRTNAQLVRFGLELLPDRGQATVSTALQLVAERFQLCAAGHQAGQLLTGYLALRPVCDHASACLTELVGVHWMYVVTHG